MAGEAQDPLGEAPAVAPGAKVPDYLAAQAPPEPAPITPGTGMIATTGIPAAQMLSGGTSADLARQAAALVPPPDPADYRAKQQNYADKVQDYVKTGGDFRDSYQAKADEVDEAARQYQQKAHDLLPQTAGVQPAPPRSLRAFLAPTENEDPYTTVSKFMQSVALLATMMGGGRNGARASVSALTGAVEGWTKGDRYRADSEYQTWKDTTEALFRQFDDEMRRYNSVMIAERVPLEQKLRGLETLAYQQKNVMAMKAFEVGQAQTAFEHLDKMRQAAVQAQFQAATIQGGYDRAQQDREIQFAKLEEASRNHLALQATKESELRVREALANIQVQQAQMMMGIMGGPGGQGGNPEMRQMLARDYFIEGKLPQIAQGRNPAAMAFKLQIINDSVQWAKDHNMDPMSGPGVRLEFAEAKKGAMALAPVVATQRASMGRLDSHIDKLIELSSKVDRSEIPALNQAIISGAVNFSGSPAAAAYLGQIQEVAAEQSKIQAGNGVGDAESKQQTREALSVGFTKEQMAAAANNFRDNSHRSIKKNEETLDHYTGIVNRIQGAKTPEVRKDVSAAETPKAPAPGSKLEGNEWVSESGKYAWRGGQWVAR